MIILIYDPATPIAYTPQTLQQSALRGTESTIIRIAHALKNTHEIYIAQHCRSTAENAIHDGVHYISFDTAHALTPDVVILLRYHRLLETVANYFPQARHYLWLHNLPPRDLHKKREVLIKHRYQLIAVSAFHKRMTERRLKGKWYHRLFRKNNHITIPVHVLYNPIPDDLQPDDTPVKSTQLIFTSSPYKGLEQVLASFTALRKRFPDYHLLIVSPNKLDANLTLPEHVSFLPPLPPHLLTQHIRESFCVFYPQTQRVETFGLVYAEANALGTPVLAHDFGAAREVLSDTDQLIDGRDRKTIIQKMEAWRRCRPTVRARPEFRLNAVLKTWLALLSS